MIHQLTCQRTHDPDVGHGLHVQAIAFVPVDDDDVETPVNVCISRLVENGFDVNVVQESVHDPHDLSVPVLVKTTAGILVIESEDLVVAFAVREDELDVDLIRFHGWTTEEVAQTGFVAIGRVLPDRKVTQFWVHPSLCSAADA